ncbi:MAG TPA: nuclear transport factor 2 family protein [Chitinophagaceae bacterium]|nr:nuclear transport factor 2 family protein [Chitinophagaceae bacterium]
MAVNKNFLVFPVLLFSLFFMISCKAKPTPVKEITVDPMVDADIAFSDMSKEKGMKNAFIEYIDNEGLLLRPDHLPIKGADAIDFLSQVDDTTYSLNWVPEGAQIAASGDMGFTYGIYTLEGEDTVFKGTYVNIWKKQADGKWKFVMNSVNQGISPLK